MKRSSKLATIPLAFRGVISLHSLLLLCTAVRRVQCGRASGEDEEAMARQASLPSFPSRGAPSIQAAASPPYSGPMPSPPAASPPPSYAPSASLMPTAPAFYEAHFLRSFAKAHEAAQPHDEEKQLHAEDTQPPQLQQRRRQTFRAHCQGSDCSERSGMAPGSVVVYVFVLTLIFAVLFLVCLLVKGRRQSSSSEAATRAARAPQISPYDQRQMFLRSLGLNRVGGIPIVVGRLPPPPSGRAVPEPEGVGGKCDMQALETRCPATAFKFAKEDLMQNRHDYPLATDTSTRPASAFNEVASDGDVPLAVDISAQVIGLAEAQAPSAVGQSSSGPEASLAAATAELVCIICLEQFEDFEIVRVLECRHCYHRVCIDTWLNQHALCPVCQRACCPNSSSSYSAAASPLWPSSVNVGGSVWNASEPPVRV
eukprot:GHVT01075029.1.p1 GENE.GHVT01075029.1~~GHVT01075029.1.p1  ORF type:complete len:426 (+),score=77.09 GHVT01075029.1:1145-2422(+)